MAVSAFRKILSPLLPENAEITWVSRVDQPFFRICWLLKNDSERPAKRSKYINLIIDDDVLDDFVDGDDSIRGEYEKALNSFIVGKLSDFDPNHSNPSSRTEVVRWVFSNRTVWPR